MPDEAPARWHELQRLLDRALDLPRADRDAWLLRICGADAALHAQAIRLLRACERAETGHDLLTTSAAAFAAPLLVEAASAQEAHETGRHARLARAVETASGGRFLLERVLGRGGMATVYRARDRRHERWVAVKVLERSVSPAGAARFLREVRTAANLTHPHIVGVHDSGDADGVLYYVMPLVDGETLRDRLHRERRLPVAHALRLFRDIADALAYAHARGLVHRDLKPANVLLTDEHALVTDFGIARALNLAVPEPHTAAAIGVAAVPADQTSAGMLLGTPAYMSPEQARGAAADARSDLYALGVVMYEALAGMHPFGERAPHAMLHAHCSEAPPSLNSHHGDVPDALAALVMGLLAKDAAHRPQDAGGVARTLDEIRAASVHEVDASRAAPPRRHMATPSARLATAVTALLLLGMAGGYATWRLAGAARAASATPEGAPVATPPPVRTVAVLPFANAGGNVHDEYFSDGITDELALALARLPGVRVAGRTSSYAFKGRAASAAEVGAALGVDAFVTGSVRRAQDRLRLTAQLVSVGDGSVLWGDVYESRSSDVFAVQDEFRAAIVAALAPSLGANELTTAPSARGTTDQQAYDLYLRGRYHFLERGAANLERAIAYFRAATARDPSFARAHAGLALTYNVLPLYVAGADSALALLEASASRAVALDSTLADARIALASAHDLNLRFAEAEAHYRAALALEPDNVTAHHWFGFLLLYTGRVDEAIAELNRAAQLDPLAKSAGSAVALALLAARRAPEANAAVRRVLAIDSTFSIALNTLGLVQVFGGAPDSAVATMERAVRLHPDAPGMRPTLLFAYAAAGRWSDAAWLRAQLHAGAAARASDVDVAFADLVFGDREPVMRLLASPRGRQAWYAEYGLGCHPFVDPLWADARFREYAHALGVRPCAYAREWPFAPPPVGRAGPTASRYDARGDLRRPPEPASSHTSRAE